jgi:hypothetical protein
MADRPVYRAGTSQGKLRALVNRPQSVIPEMQSGGKVLTNLEDDFSEGMRVGRQQSRKLCHSIGGHAWHRRPG